MVILGIETSCDETAAAVLQKDGDRITILSNIVASSANLQAKYGGIIPEQAAREQIKAIIPIINEAIENCKLKIVNLDAIAVTFGPGLIGSLLVGVETAKTLAKVWNKPLIPINHLLGHFYANWIVSAHLRGVKAQLGGVPSFPCLGLLVSGGHTDLVLFTNHGKYEYLGGTRDDAAGECFDKCARLLGLPYPGGPAIAHRAMEFRIQNSKFKIELPRPLINENSFDFSFSGLKTATLREVERLKVMKQFKKETVTQLAYEIQEAIIDSLVNKVLLAIKKYNVEQIMVAGGVAANKKLVNKLVTLTKDKTITALPTSYPLLVKNGGKARLQSSADIKSKAVVNLRDLQKSSPRRFISLHVPPPNLCTDNGAMIAAAGFFTKPISNPSLLQADPNLSLVY